MNEYLEESNSLKQVQATKASKAKYKKGTHKPYEFEIMMFLRRQQETFKFWNLTITKGFKKIPEEVNILQDLVENEREKVEEQAQEQLLQQK